MTLQSTWAQRCAGWRFIVPPLNNLTTLQYATRLMIVKGRFEALSMAIYGEIVSESPPVQIYEPKPFSSLEPVPLSRKIDPSSSSHPIQLAEQLLSLIPDSPPLPLVVRLMFCLKPSDDDWDHPDFPYLYADLEGDDESFDLEGIVQAISRPIRDDTSEEVLLAFVNRIVELIGPKVSGCTLKCDDTERDL